MPKFVDLIVFLQKLISKEHVVVIIEFPDWVQVKKIHYMIELKETLITLLLKIEETRLKLRSIA